MALATPFLYCTPSENMKLHYLVMGDWQKSNTLTLYCLPCNKTKSGAAPLYNLHPHHQNHLLHFTCNKRIVQVWVELRVELRVEVGVTVEVRVRVGAAAAEAEAVAKEEAGVQGARPRTHQRPCRYPHPSHPQKKPGCT